MLKTAISGLLLSSILTAPNAAHINTDIIDAAIKTNVESVLNLEVDHYAKFRELGFYKEEYADENLNRRNALLRFQSEHNLTVDGMIGPEVRGAMLRRIIEVNYKYTDIVENSPSNNYWIAINKTKRILTLYKGKEVVKKYPIAQGREAGFTPEGKFAVVRKTVNPSWSYEGKSAKGGAADNPLGRRWIGISHGGGGLYGVHGNNSPYSIGTNVSLGCVRMINSDVEELFHIIPNNIPIWIGRSSQLRNWGISQESYFKTTLQ